LATAAAFMVAPVAAQAQDQPTPEAGASDQAKPAPKKHKAKAAKPAGEQKAAKAKKLPFVAVTVSNNRSVSLVELTASFSGKTGDSVSVTKDLPGGKKTVAHLAHDKDCLFDLHGVFDDGQTSDAVGVDLCKDKAINLNE
jgi:hypothetical protein